MEYAGATYHVMARWNHGQAIYTGFGALLSEDGPWSDDTVSYTYTTNRLRDGLSLQEPNGPAWAQSYAYDAAARLTTLTSPAGSFAYSYLAAQGSSPASLVNKLLFPNAAYITNAFDTVGHLTGTYLKTSANVTTNSHVYAYNAGNQRTKQTRVEGSYVDYTYDNSGQLKTAKGTESGGSTNRVHEQFGYAYDAAGNLNYRTNNVFVQTFGANNLNQFTNVTRSGSLTVAGTTSSTATNVTVNSTNAILYNDNTFARTNYTLLNGNNTLTAVAKDRSNRTDTSSVTINLPSTVTFKYDGNGNLTNDGTRAFFYDDKNQLTNVTVSSLWKSEFIYDGKMRRRVRKEYSWVSSAWVQSSETRYIYDGNLVIQERDNNNVPTVSYTRGLDLSGGLEGAGGIGGLLARTDNGQLTANSPSAHAYYHADGNGNITSLISTQQVVVARYLYDPFGNTLSASGPLSQANLYRFSSKELHANSGLVYYLYRFYDPNLQRWLNRDPMEERGGINLFGFVRNNPVERLDFWGLTFQLPDDAPVVSKETMECDCNFAAALKAKVQIKLAGIKGDDTTAGGNAMLHCVATCSAVKACGMNSARKFWTEREKKDLDSQTDLINNETGYQHSSESSCFDACMDSWKGGFLTCHDSIKQYPCPPPKK